MAGLTKREKEALEMLKEKLTQEFGERLDSTQLFGSKARGDAVKHSDVDVLVVLKDATWRDRRSVSHLSAEVLFDVGVLLSAKTFSPDQIEEMRRERSMFWQAIEPDLVLI